jgi:hypothetical protein
MAFNTKISLDNGKVMQADGCLLILSGDTKIDALGTLQYCTDQSSTYIARSIVDAAYVTGKTSCGNAISALSITGASNGLSKLGAHCVKLGGTLTGVTTITFPASPATQLTFTDNRIPTIGVQYGGCYHAGYTPRSLVDAEYVTGKTNAIITCYAPVINSAITGATNGLCKFDSRNVCLGGALSSNIIIGTGSNTFGVCAGKVNLTGVTVNLGGCVLLKTVPPTLVANILTYNSGTGEISQTSISAINGITGATNGIGTTTLQRVCLGGALIAGTSITDNFALCLGTAASRLASVDIRPIGATTIVTGTLPISSSGATFTDLTLTTKEGIKYASDYSLTYNVRSLVDKGYVDTVAVGLTVHAAVVAATTLPIVLSGSPITIDGVSLVTGQRVLVKNQASAPTNGIYVVSGTTWGRASDYDGIPSGEVANGDLIPVTSGLTQNSSIWVLVTPNPITVGVTSLNFSEFSTVIDIQAGQGIAITQVGGVHTACVLLPGGSGAACGLAVSNTGLCIDSNIAGCALSYSAGVLCVNAASCSSVPAIPVGYNAGSPKCLVVACSDIRTAVSAITGATNGLTSTSCVVKLGGALCETTTINGAQTLRVNTCYFNVTGTTGLCLNTGCGVITTSNSKGLEYASNYNATFDNESLITKRYVCSQTSGITGGYLCCANNGLNKAGQNVRLGGQLTGTTTINGAQTLNINQTILNLSGNTSVNITGTAVTLQTTPPAGSINDSVLVWNVGDKQLKTVSGAALGDKNNVYSKTIVSINTTGTTASTYVQLISGATSFTLPITPITGQAFKIKDACGNALANNIIVNAGSGKIIDGSQCALINTDYGALELVYGATNKWFSLAFVN